MHDFATYFGSKPSWNSCQFEIITQNNTNEWQMHDFVTYFGKLRPTTRKHDNKTEEQAWTKKQTLGTTKLFTRLLYFETPYFQSNPESPKHQKYWQQTCMEQQPVRHNHTKQHTPLTNARFCTYFVKLMPTTRKHNSKTREKREKETNTADAKKLFIRLLYLKTPYFQSLPESMKHQKLY